jgi:1-acyl-sn-glycerol-3-phosphate acyltransferase
VPLSHYFASLIVIIITGIDMQVRNVQGTIDSVQAKRGMVLPFQPLSLAFNHVNYYVDMPVVSHFFSTNICIKVFFFICEAIKKIQKK